MLSTDPLLFYQLLSPCQTFVVLSPFLIKSPFTLSTHPINVPALHTKQRNSLSRLIERTPSGAMRLRNSTGFFGHRAILMWGGGGDRGMAGGFHQEHPDAL